MLAAAGRERLLPRDADRPRPRRRALDGALCPARRPPAAVGPHRRGDRNAWRRGRALGARRRGAPRRPRGRAGVGGPGARLGCPSPGVLEEHGHVARVVLRQLALKLLEFRRTSSPPRPPGRRRPSGWTWSRGCSPCARRSGWASTGWRPSPGWAAWRARGILPRGERLRCTPARGRPYPARRRSPAEGPRDRRAHGPTGRGPRPGGGGGWRAHRPPGDGELRDDGAAAQPPRARGGHRGRGRALPRAHQELRRRAVDGVPARARGRTSQPAESGWPGRRSAPGWRRGS